jgi:hypothetical protein
MKLPLGNGYCCGRFICKNVNKKVCHADPKNRNNFVICDYFKSKATGRKRWRG